MPPSERGYNVKVHGAANEERLKKATEDFMRKVLESRMKGRYNDERNA